MNRISRLSKMLLLFCFSLMLSAYNAGSTINNVLIVPYVNSEPTIDGVEDSSWTFPQVGMFAYTDLPDNAADLSAYYKLAWDDFHIYLFVHVVDDTIVTSHPDSWRRDCIEIFIDGGNEDATSYDTNDVQWRATALDSVLTPCWNAGTELIPPSYELAWMENTDGYDMELAIPDTGLVKTGVASGNQLFYLIPGTTIGWELHVTDADDSTGSDAGLRWWGTSAPYSYPNLMGTAKLGDTNAVLQIPQVDSAPTVDGVLDTSWTNRLVPEVAMSVIAIAGTTWMYPDGGQADFCSWFRVAHNASGDLCFFGRVTDDSIAIGTTDWSSDNWEIYIDGDNSKDSSYDLYDDVHYRFVYGQDSATLGPGPSDCDVAWVETADGYTWELLILAATLADTNITLDMGKIIGFEVQCSDNDGSSVGDGREAITKWWNPSNDSYINPRLFGTAIITLSNSDEVSEVNNRNISLITPPILTSVTDITYTIPARSSVRVSVINVLGQIVDTPVSGVQSAGTYTTSLGDNLANGIYLIKLDACNQSVGKKSLILK